MPRVLPTLMLISMTAAVVGGQEHAPAASPPHGESRIAASGQGLVPAAVTEASKSPAAEREAPKGPPATRAKRSASSRTRKAQNDLQVVAERIHRRIAEMDPPAANPRPSTPTPRTPTPATRPPDPPRVELVWRANVVWPPELLESPPER